MEPTTLLLSALVKTLINHISSLPQFEAIWLWDFKRDLKRMEQTLDMIHAETVRTEKRLIEDKNVDNWLKELKDTAFDIQDLLTDFHLAEEGNQNLTLKQKVSLKQKVCKFFSSSNSIVATIIMAYKMSRMRNKIDFTANMKQRYIKEENSNHEMKKIILGLETFSSVDDDVYGREDEKQVIVDWLLHESHERPIDVIAIVGIGGIGKTTLANFVCNDEEIKSTFGEPIWVYVTKEFELPQVGKRILESATSVDHHQTTNLELLKKKLHKVLSARKFLLVLDGIWSVDDRSWTSLIKMLQNKKGSKIIVTTRDPEVAEMCRRNADAVQLKPLSEENCWQIFKTKAFKTEDDEKSHPELVTIGREIVKKCGGIPLVAYYLGATLQITSENDKWEYVRDNDIYELHKNEPEARKILSSLWLTYFDMPPELKLCFAYCSIFPKDHVINEDKLVNQWLAMGFIKPNVNGKTFVKKLKSMSFLVEVENDEATGREEHKLIDIVHGLAQLAAGDGVATSNLREEVETNGKEYHYVTLIGSKMEEARIDCSCLRRARALHFRDCENGSYVSRIFSSVERLRVIDLSGISQLTELPGPLNRMKKLRYLDAPKLSSDQCNGLNVWFGYFSDSKEGVTSSQVEVPSTRKPWLSKMLSFKLGVRGGKTS